MRFLLLLLLTAISLHAADYRPSNGDQPPMPRREFRGAWVASVWNVDWPSKPGLTPAKQRAELLSLLDLAAELRLNAIVLQVRPESDALYQSDLEPWSYWLTGKMGRPPGDGYDPLAFAIQEAHARGLELHAWFNPFRARATQSQPASASHITRKDPQYTMQAGSQVWLNPGLKAAQDHALKVIGDVVKRYDIDAVHLDDYFYPYPADSAQGKKLTFDDSAAFRAYQKGGGRLAVGDWRREQIDDFIQRLNTTVKTRKPWVKTGVSPFGIWRPGVPASIEASLDSYNHLFADSRKWLHEGWVDYLSPQLYWRIDDAPHSFTTLLDWWQSQNPQGRHLWPGIASSRIKSADDKTRPAQESVNQIGASRRLATTAQGSGHIHWSMSALRDDRDGLKGKLSANSYPDLALIPESPWLRRANIAPPTPPLVKAQSGAGKTIVEWSAGPDESNMGVRWWVIQAKASRGADWRTVRVMTGAAGRLTLNGEPQAIAVRAVDPTWRVSTASVVAR